MPVALECPFCKTHLRLPDSGTGHAVRCPRCGTAIRIPAVTATKEDAPPRSGPPPRH
jgi:predicted Zn finger-like uncharacterized protein